MIDYIIKLPLFVLAMLFISAPLGFWQMYKDYKNDLPKPSTADLVLFIPVTFVNILSFWALFSYISKFI